MGGGLMQLVAYGAQDVYLSGNPQITFFKVVYRRHTNFSMETIEHAIDSCRPGGRYTVTVHRNGDLVTNGGLKVRVPAVDAVGTWKMSFNDKDQVAWCRRLGHAMIKQVEVEIGGSKIDKQLGVWMDIWHELTCPAAQERGYRECIGDVDSLTALRTVSDSGSNDIDSHTMYIPFQFWWCRNSGLALPLIALQYHEVRLHIELESADKLVVWSGTAPNLSSWSFGASSVMVDYVYLDAEERRRFAQVGHEYLIEQVQNPGADSINGSTSKLGDTVSEKFKLNFNHPCKEIVWAAKVGAWSGEGNNGINSANSKFLAYTHKDKWTNALDQAAKSIVESAIGAVFSNPGDGNQNTEVAASESAGHVEITAAAEDSPVIVTSGANPNNIAVSVIEAKGTNSEYSAGDAALGKTNVMIQVKENNILVKGNIDLMDRILDADVQVTITEDQNVQSVVNVECVAVRHNLTLRDISVPIDDSNLVRAPATGADASKCVNWSDVHVVQCHNYGLRLDGKGNPVSTALIQLNGHDRASVQEGGYYNYWQTRAHTRTPSDGVNVYSFALHPENHQPSGTANLSRIDTTVLNVTFTDSLRPKGSKCPHLDWVTSTKVHIFAVNYNVLRVMSGMGGIAYSN